MGARIKALLIQTPAAKAISGLIICSVAAGGLTVIFRNMDVGAFVPLVFLLVVGGVAWFLGTWAALLGLITGSTIFTEFLYPPIRKLLIAAGSTRINMAMMLLFGIAVAYFYGRRSMS